MNDTRLMSCFKTRRHLPNQWQRLVRRHFAALAKVLGQRLSAQKLHRQEYNVLRSRDRMSEEVIYSANIRR